MTRTHDERGRPVTQERSYRHEGLATLELARVFAIEAGRQLRAWGLPDGRIALWEVAVAEMATNVSKHGYPADAPGPMELMLSWDDAGLTICIADEGRPFDPARVQPPDPDPDPDDPSTWPEGGMGLHLVRSAGDRLTYRSTGARHELCLFTAMPRSQGPVEA